MNLHLAKYESAIDRLRADMANLKIWLFAVVTGITLGLSFAG